MQVLQVNKFLWENGGPERYMFELADVLQAKGHEVLFFAMQHPRNRPSPHSQFFVSEIQYRNTSAWYKLRTALRTAGKTIYSPESHRKMEHLLSAIRPDIAHLHVISRQISPSILPVLKRFGIPMVQTLHNAELVCPAAHLYIEHKRQVCERCLGGHYYHALFGRCVQGSLAASALMLVAQYAHRRMKVFERHVDLFLAPSRFLLEKLVEGGIPRERLRHLPNFIDVARYPPSDEPGSYGVFLGRLSPEKGLLTLLKAAALAREVPLVIVGEGSQREELQRLVAQNDLRHVTLAGYKRDAELVHLLRQAAFLVLPSECYENSPMVIYEAGALGRPVLASRMGGIPELVDEGETGFLFAPGDATELAERMVRLHRDPRLRRDMGQNGRRKIVALCEGHYDQLMSFYHEARNGVSSRSPTKEPQTPVPQGL
ncbi:MAG: glycosyltransferase family 4 protein [Thermoguttaceae bacterium]|jgi:glycosyltransferase involved in cell wall biosynthesis